MERVIQWIIFVTLSDDLAKLAAVCVIEEVILMAKEYDVIILGGGAAGLSVALYTCRAMLKTLVIEELGCGGQILITDMIENYPGFPNGVRGPELGMLMEEQTRNFGAEIIYENIIGVEDLDKPIKKILTNENIYSGKTVIIATGGSHNKLGISGEEEYSGKGVSYCAVCDANFFRDQDVVVVGGGDAAIDEGNYLTGIVKSVTVIHRRDHLRASKILQERAINNPKMKFLWSHTVEEILGKDIMESVRLRNLKTGETSDYAAAAAFIYIGFHSNSDFLKGHVKLDETGHVYTDIQMETDILGVYACGDIRVNSDRQLGTSVGDGITAALSAYRHLSEI